MNFSGKGASSGDKKLSSGKKATLNPNATEFVPFALRSQAAGFSNSDASSKFRASVAGGPPGKSILDRSESPISKYSDEEAQQYWRHQLPDDITPDFKVMGLDNNTQEINGLSFSSLSLTDVDERPRLPRPLNGDNYAEKQRYDVSSYGEYPSPMGSQASLAKPWDKQIVDNDWLLAREGHSYRVDFLADVSNEQILMDNEDVSPLEFLASQFPDFAAESLMEVYFANGGDLNLTIEMLTQLELQVELDGGLNQTLNSKALSNSNLSASNFPALSVRNGQNGLEKDSTLFFRSFSSIQSRGATDFASAVRKLAPQDSSIWKYDKKGSSETSIGSSRSSQVMGSSYNSGQGRGIYGNSVQNRGPARAFPAWLETGETVGNIYWSR